MARRKALSASTWFMGGARIYDIKTLIQALFWDEK